MDYGKAYGRQVLPMYLRLERQAVPLHFCTPLTAVGKHEGRQHGKEPRFVQEAGAS